MDEMTVSIIGAGIGGLTTALALQKNKIRYTLYESAASIQTVGAGIIIANNAMQVYRYLGLDDSIRKAGIRISKMKITTPELSSLSVLDLTGYESKYEQCNVAIHRGILQKILFDHVGMENVRLDKRLKDVSQDSSGYVMQFEDGCQISTQFLIGADGIRSNVRAALFGKIELRNACQVCWRGVCRFDVPLQYQHEVNEAWGKGKRFGFMRIEKETVYWFALTNLHSRDQKDVDLAELFRDFHPVMQALIKATPKEAIFYDELFDLSPMTNWNTGNACLIGDAAHATTPNLGQGACQAIEDAYVLGRLLERKMDISAAFANYPGLRMAKANEVVDRSWKLGKMAQLENGLQIGIRNLLMKVAPSFIMRRQMDKVFKLQEL